MKIGKGNAGVLLVLSILVIGVLSMSGCIEFGGTTSPPTTTSDCCEFSISPAVSASNGVLSADKTKVTVPFRSNTTAHTVTEGDNSTWVDPILTFTIKPECPSSATKSTLANINYEVINEDGTVNSDTGTHYMITKTSNVWQCIWTGDGTQYVDGYSSMDPTENLTMTLTLDIDQTGLSYTQNTYDGQELNIRFYNDCWSESFTVEFSLIEAYA
jgi:hypothetical protein